MNNFTAQHRYYTLDVYLKQIFNAKVFKIPLNGGFTCPNRDGTRGNAGCLFCSEQGSGEYGGNPAESLERQFQEGKRKLHNKWPKAKYIVYFQANTNTYADIRRLRAEFEQAVMLDKNIVALSIATRCDVIKDDILAYLSELNKALPVWIEIGLQTVHNKTMKAMNLGYDRDLFAEAARRTAKAGLTTIAHIINGLPGETREMMIETASFLNNCGIKGIKIHSLYLVKNSPLGRAYIRRPFPLLDLDNYTSIVCEQLAALRSDIVIHRINGDPPRENFIAPVWALKKFVIMNEIDKKMRALGYYQGCKYVGIPN